MIDNYSTITNINFHSTDINYQNSEKIHWFDVSAQFADEIENELVGFCVDNDSQNKTLLDNECNIINESGECSALFDKLERECEKMRLIE